MSSKLEELRKQIENARKEFQKNSEEILKETFNELFQKYDKLEKFSWTQGDYYNDEETRFRVFSDSPNINGNDSENWSKEEAEYFLKAEKDIVKILRTLTEEDFERIFGNGSEITVTREKIQIEEWDYGY